MKDTHIDSKEITSVAIGIAAMICGGIVIYQVSTVFPIPGSKYMIMSPYLSMVIFILLSRISNKWAVLEIGCVFSFIMVFINVFMGVAIISTSMLTQLSIILIENPKTRAFVGSLLFSGYTGFCALGISKYVVGGVFRNISNTWLVYTGLICLVFGFFGTLLARRIQIHLNMYSYR